MSKDAAAERDELAHSQNVPIGDEVLPLTIDNPPPVSGYGRYAYGGRGGLSTLDSRVTRHYKL